MLALGSPTKCCHGGFPIGAVKGLYVNFVYVDRIETTRIHRVSIGMRAWDINRFYAASSTELVFGGARVEVIRSEGGLT